MSGPVGPVTTAAAGSTAPLRVPVAVFAEIAAVMMSLWSRVRAGKPHEATYVGRYELLGTRINGTVADQLDSPRCPAAVVVLLGGQTIAETSRFGGDPSGWMFRLDLGAPVGAEDVLKGRLKVLAQDPSGKRHNLPMDGSCELSFIREVYARPAAEEALFDFSIAGNAGPMLPEGWYGPEAEYRWTKGARSIIALDLAQPGADYGLELSLWALIVREKINAQRLNISVAGDVLARFSVGPGPQVIDCDIPGALTGTGKVLIVLDHPDAARACDVRPTEDERTLALAVKRLKVKRYLGSAPGASP